MKRSLDRHPSLELMRAAYRTMKRIRTFEERLADLISADGICTPCHLYIGQEAIAAGVCLALERRDYVWGGHRSHGHYLAKGGNLKAMMAEIYGKATGCSRGRGGSMHLCAPEVGIPGTVPLVAATIPLAAGAALASKLSGDGRVSVSFFGDGATEEGHFHESLNIAALYRLPVIFVCENNLYSSHMHIFERRRKDNIEETGTLHGLETVRIDGNDVFAVYAAAAEAVKRARQGEGPALLECRTYRWRGHVGPGRDMDVGVKRPHDLEEWMEKDPIVRLRDQMLKAGYPAEFESVDRECREEVEEAVRFARESPYPDPTEVTQHVF
jgi:acetoin:2,6-dichlorophenolindophenol oxidoreductase subunit alpha